MHTSWIITATITLRSFRDGMDVRHVEDELIDTYFPWGIAGLQKR